MPPLKAVSYAMLAVVIVVAVQGGRPLLLLAVATGALGALRMWGHESCAGVCGMQFNEDGRDNARIG